jgi:hypothetical protein
MATKLIRVAAGQNSTLSHLYINELFQCYLLEDAVRKSKIAGITAIPTGDFRLTLNTTAGMNRDYEKRFKGLHEGMIEIDGIPTFDLVFFHIGNKKEDTKGCPLTGHYWANDGKDFGVFNSTQAYQLVYPKLLELVKTGNDLIQVSNVSNLLNPPMSALHHQAKKAWKEDLK